MSSAPIEYLQHILAEANFLVERVEGTTRDEFLADETLKRAFFAASKSSVERPSILMRTSANNIPKSNGGP